MPCIVGRHLDIANLERLVQLDRLDFTDAILDHLRAEAVHFALLSHGNFPKVLQHERNDCFGRWCGDNGPRVPNSFREVGQSATVIQVKVRNETHVNHICQIELLARASLLVDRLAGGVLATVQESEVGELLLVDHVDTAVEHYGAAADLDNDAGAADVLPCA
jgi:hypothetical protein